MIKHGAAALALFFGISGQALSQGYVGASIGQAEAKDACDGLAGLGISCDDSDTAWKIFGGYQFTPNFAAELGYSDGGEIKLSAGGLREKIEASIFELVGIGSAQVADRLALCGKLGIYRAEVDDSTNFGFSAEETNNDLTFGFGARFDISSSAALRIEWQRYQDVGGGDIGESDLDVMSAGVLVMF